MYTFWKVMAGITVVVHGILHLWSTTDFFNRVFMGVGVFVLLLPRKWWPVYVLPVIVMLAGLITGGLLLFYGLTQSGALF